MADARSNPKEPQSTPVVTDKERLRERSFNEIRIGEGERLRSVLEAEAGAVSLGESPGTPEQYERLCDLLLSAAGYIKTFGLSTPEERLGGEGPGAEPRADSDAHKRASDSYLRAERLREALVAIETDAEEEHIRKFARSVLNDVATQETRE